MVLTEAAANALNEICLQHNYGRELRLGVRGGGCSGLEYSFDLKTESFDGDEEFNFSEYDIKIYVDAMSLSYLEGTTIDYVSSIMGKNFVFINPQATSQCGCGNSFGV